MGCFRGKYSNNACNQFKWCVCVHTMKKWHILDFFWKYKGLPPIFVKATATYENEKKICLFETSSKDVSLWLKSVWCFWSIEFVVTEGLVWWKREVKSPLLTIFIPFEGHVSEKGWATPYTFIEIKIIIILLLLGSTYII